jgi:two-component system, OmpR family, alkaline phosphatase synthesis response regulator PhoP
VNKHKILIIDNPQEDYSTLTPLLHKSGFEVFLSNSAENGIAMVDEVSPHLILIEIILQGIDGVEACLELRKKQKLNKSIIAICTSRKDDYSQIAAFNAGADDYIFKPLAPRVLLHRIKALMRRYYSDYKTPENFNIIGNLKIDREKYLIYKDSNEIVLPRKEFELLSLLISKPEKVFTRNEILSKVWGYEYENGNRTIDVHVRKIREKLGENYIATIKGVGYKLKNG